MQSTETKQIINFTKMHGMGNDFIVIDAYSKNITLTTQQIIQISNRHTGIGADQVLLIEKTLNTDCDFKYRIFNADGSEVEHCGNGARCFMLYVHQKKLTQKTKINVEIMKGIITLKLMSQNTVEVNMGKPKLDANSVDFDENDNTVIANTLTNLDGIDYKLYSINDSNNNVISFSVVSMGNPHAVQIVENLANYDVENKGKWLESNPLFKKRVNAGFIQIIDKHNIHIRVYERGAGETMACGTGACAAVVSAITQGLVTSPVNVHTKGGILNITWDKSLNADVIMQGGATSVFEGIISI